MRIALVNPPYRAVSSSHGTGEQVPLGLLAIGGPLVDAGHEVILIDAEARRLSMAEIVAALQSFRPEAIMTGHGGSTPAHPTVVRMAREIKAALPGVPLIYGGVYPTYHGTDILNEEAAIDIIVRGEGERTAVLLADALAAGGDPGGIPGLVLRRNGTVLTTPPAEMIADLDACRVGWELIEDWDRYQCWGAGRSAIVQFSRGCPHRCIYCGQRGFWSRWRYRTPEKVAAEIAWLHRTHGVNFVDFADENPTSSRRLWQRFLEAMIAEQVPVKLFASIRAGDIVRDAALLPLYRQAGLECCIMGLESTDAETLRNIGKDSTPPVDRQAIALLRQNGILSMAGHIVGFEHERLSDYWRAFRLLVAYDPDLVNAMYVTPHRWTPLYARIGERRVVQEDRSKWDYRHQVLATRHLRPWQVFLAVKAMEAALHLRPRSLARAFFHSDAALRRALRWCLRNASRVWFDEVADFFVRSRHRRDGPALADFLGHAGEGGEFALQSAIRLPAGAQS